MKTFSSFLVCLFLSQLIISGPPEPKVGYRWVLNKQYSDEFNGNSLDASKWNKTFKGWKGRRPAKFEPKTISVKNGTMQIKNQVSTNPGDGYTIDGGAVQSKETTAHFGYYECRFKSSRIAMSTTFWLSNPKKAVNFPTKKSNGQNCSRDSFSQELDIAESIGGVFNGTSSFRNNMNFNTHYRYVDCNGGKEKFFSRGNNSVEGSGKNNAKLSSESWQDFHTYGAYWKNANDVSFYADNKYVGDVKVSTEVVDKPFPDPMRINMVTETYNWAKPHPSPQQLRDNKINTSYYDWIRAYELIPIEKAPKSSKFKAGKVFKETISFFENTKLIDGNKKAQVSYLYAANVDREFRLRIVDANKKEVFNSGFKVLEGYGKNRKTINLGKVLSNGNYTFIGELREQGTNELIASTSNNGVVIGSNPEPQPKPTPKPQPNPTPQPNPVPSNNDNPAVSFIKPTLFNLVEGANISVEVKATDKDGIQNVKLYLDNKFVGQQGSVPYRFGFREQALKSIKPGTYELKAVATDRKGNMGEVKITLNVASKNAPTPKPVTPKPTQANNSNVSFSKPTNLNVRVGATVNVDVNAIANDGVANVKLYVNNKFVRQENVKPYTWGGNDNALKNLKEGTYELKAVATDKKGKTTEAKLVVTVSNQSNSNGSETSVSQNLSGTYSIKLSKTGQRLLSRDKEQFNVITHNYGNWDDQLWVIKLVSGNLYTIQNKGNKRYLSVVDNCKGGANVTATNGAKGSSSTWEIVKVGTQYQYSLRPQKCKSFALDVERGSVDGNVQLWNLDTKSNNQKFELIKVSGNKVLTTDGENLKVRIAPNPAQAYVEIEGVTIDDVVVLTNLLGQELQVLVAKSETERINLQAYDSGVYFIKIGNSLAKRLVISN
ncbi:Ig-like domain-containing protein [Aquimarina agarilytica]|uniref:Ig-like domain-containing protein n=1 Tax=Aquimarina agarilytica TaxID=1087449 RepID=UPI0002897C54|nr:Ig-like domain-containing protein [Aquimarina agarilytica]